METKSNILSISKNNVTGHLQTHIMVGLRYSFS